MTVAVVVLLVAVGLAMDGGTVYVNRRRMQNAADAAAREGARQLYVWQVKVDYPDDETGQRALLSAVHTVAEASGVRDTNGAPGDSVNDNVTAYYVDSLGYQLSGTPITDPDGGTLAECLSNKCAALGSGRCCGVAVEVNTAVDTSLVRLVGPSSAPVEAGASAAFIVSDGLGGVGDFAMLACGSGCCEEQLKISGDGLLILGTAHSNDGVEITLDHPIIDRLAYVNKSCVMTSTIDYPEFGSEEEVDPEYSNCEALPYYTEYYQNYAAANDWMDDVHNIEGDFVHIADDIDLNGLYYVDGDVIIQGDNVDLLLTTIVATGQIRIQTNSVDLSPWPHPENAPWGDVALYSAFDAGVDKCSSEEAGIWLEGDRPEGEGVIFCPASRIYLEGNPGYWKGMVIGWSIEVPGDDWTFEHDAPELGAVGELERITLVR
jgi:Flp pilus assembly protein TadG